MSEDQAIGRPSLYGDDKVALARMYLEGGWEEQGDAVPQIAGLALAVGVTRETVYKWAKDPEKQAFSDIFTRVQAIQERKLVNRGLTGEFNPAITKMMLTKHGYSDKQEIDHTTLGEAMTPAIVERVIVDPHVKDTD